MSSIKHIFVLMMENRSFDHLLAFSGRSGVAPPDANWGMTADAPDRSSVDPPHEFQDVQAQIAGTPPMSGFQTQTYWDMSRRGFSADNLPILTTLANKYFLFDNWYSSLPGPTWPNRFFIHAGSSGGLDNSPSAATTIESETIDSLSFSFPSTLYMQLEASNRTWRVYHDDLFPQVLAIRDMIDPFRLNTSHFSWIRSGGTEYFVNDLAKNYNVDYTFIEPNYGLSTNGFENGNCQHPVGSMAAGEAFIKYIYESIRNSPVWQQSLLVVTYDEHGGFFDHVDPPAAVPPANGTQNQKRAEHPQNFAFDRLGVRVPTIAISPWIPKGGLGSQTFPDQTFDHTSMIKTVMNIFTVAGALGNRETAAPSFESICSLTEMRTEPTDVPVTLPAPADQPKALASSAAVISDTEVLPETTTKAFSRIAMSLDLSVQAATGQSAVALGHSTFTEATASPLAAVTAEFEQVIPRAAPPARTKQQTLSYIQEVAARVGQAQLGSK